MLYRHERELKLIYFSQQSIFHTEMAGIDETTKRKMIGVIRAVFPLAKIYLFGSQARGDFKERSDIDIAIDGGHALPRVDVGEVKDMLNASHIPYPIDVVDYWAVSKAMQKAIRKESILWND